MTIYEDKKSLNEFIKKGYKFADMHVHSNYSPDCSTKVEDIISIANKKSIGIAITDHNEIKGALEALRYNAFLIPGIEITCKEGCHILVYFYNIKDLKKFYNKNIKNNFLNKMRIKLSHRDLFKILNNYKCIISAAHPFGSGKCGLYKIKDYSDIKIIEGINASIKKFKNKKAVAKNKIFTAGSDSHELRHIGKALTGVKSKNIKEFLDGIKDNKNVILGEELNFTQIFWLNLKKEISLIKKMKLKDFIKNRLIQIK